MMSWSTFDNVLKDIMAFRQNGPFSIFHSMVPERQGCVSFLSQLANHKDSREIELEVLHFNFLSTLNKH